MQEGCGSILDGVYEAKYTSNKKVYDIQKDKTYVINIDKLKYAYQVECGDHVLYYSSEKSILDHWDIMKRY